MVAAILVAVAGAVGRVGGQQFGSLVAVGTVDPYRDT